MGIRHGPACIGGGCGLRFAEAAHHILLEEYIQAVEAARAA
jgi:hypothetical protein